MGLYVACVPGTGRHNLLDTDLQILADGATRHTPHERASTSPLPLELFDRLDYVALLFAQRT